MEIKQVSLLRVAVLPTAMAGELREGNYLNNFCYANDKSISKKESQDGSPQIKGGGYESRFQLDTESPYLLFVTI